MISECICGEEFDNIPALAHLPGCPIKLAFFGAPAAWGVGRYGEVRVDHRDGQMYRFGAPGTWHRYNEEQKETD